MCLRMCRMPCLGQLLLLYVWVHHGYCAAAAVATDPLLYRHSRVALFIVLLLGGIDP